MLSYVTFLQFNVMHCSWMRGRRPSPVACSMFFALSRFSQVFFVKH